MILHPIAIASIVPVNVISTTLWLCIVIVVIIIIIICLIDITITITIIMIICFVLCVRGAHAGAEQLPGAAEAIQAGWQGAPYYE